MGGWWRWALVSPDGVAPSQMVGVSASVNIPLHHKVQKFSTGTGSPGWSRKKGRKAVVVWWCGIQKWLVEGGCVVLRLICNVSLCCDGDWARVIVVVDEKCYCKMYFVLCILYFAVLDNLRTNALLFCHVTDLCIEWTDFQLPTHNRVLVLINMWWR